MAHAVPGRPLETLKPFTISVPGCDVAQCKPDDRVMFVVLDPQSMWADDETLRQVVEIAPEHLRQGMGFLQPAELDFIRIVPGSLGRHFCPKCPMCFEFGKVRDKVICPLTPQKCMFDRGATAGQYPLADLLKIYRITPHLYALPMEAARRFSKAELERSNQSTVGLKGDSVPNNLFLDSDSYGSEVPFRSQSK